MELESQTPSLPHGPPGFHLLASPGGSTCNIDWAHCGSLANVAHPKDERRMSQPTLEAYIRQLLESHSTPQVTVAWQRGEPASMSIEFFRRAVALVEKARKPQQVIEHTFQTNGIGLDEDWCAFFKEQRFRVGLRVDGPRELHDTYRKDEYGNGTFDKVMEGWAHLRRHGVDLDVHCAVSAANEKHGRAVYRFFRDQLGAKWIQFTPVVERRSAQLLHVESMGWSDRPGKKRPLSTQAGSSVTSRTVGAEQYGRFLVDIFDEWVRKDVGRIHVQLFDATLEGYFGRSPLCTHAPTCGYDPALVHNGDLYSCGHFVEPQHRLGNIHEKHMLELVASPAQRKFGQDKHDTLTAQCRTCRVRPVCNGGCPKDRFTTSRDGEEGHNYLCRGLELFFTHTRPAMLKMAVALEMQRAPSEVMAWVAAQDERRLLGQPAPAGTCQ